MLTYYFTFEKFSWKFSTDLKSSKPTFSVSAALLKGDGANSKGEIENDRERYWPLHKTARRGASEPPNQWHICRLREHMRRAQERN